MSTTPTESSTRQPTLPPTLSSGSEVVRLYHIGPMQATEIARHLDIPEGTVKSWIKRHLEDPYFKVEEAA
jgi:DNA-directed RNA polymerase specialized sigma24 family protein